MSVPTLWKPLSHPSSVSCGHALQADKNPKKRLLASLRGALPLARPPLVPRVFRAAGRTLEQLEQATNMLSPTHYAVC